MKRFGVNARRSRSEVTPSKRWKTACLFTRVGIPQGGNRLSGGTSRRSRYPLKHVHPNPAQPRSHSRKKRRVPREARLRLPWSVWADAHGFEDRGRRPTPLKPCVATQTGLEGRLSPRPSRLPGSSLRAPLVGRTCFRYFSYPPQNVDA